MLTISRDRITNWAIRTATTIAALIIVGSALIAWLLHDRPILSAIEWPAYPEFEAGADAVTVTWLGVTTLLFDDGDTQVLIDGFFSRPSLADIVFGVSVQSNAAHINYIIDEYQLSRLAAIIPVHSHFDHAMDIGAIANRSSASILGSVTTAQLASGAGVPADQIVVPTRAAWLGRLDPLRRHRRRATRIAGSGQCLARGQELFDCHCSSARHDACAR